MKAPHTFALTTIVSEIAKHTKTKPTNTVRIALLGDSFSEAMHLPMEQTLLVAIAAEV